MIVWRGAGAVFLLVFIAAHFLFNWPLMQHYQPAQFGLLKWWPSLFVAAAAAWLIADYSARQVEETSAGKPAGRFLKTFGTEHSVFFIPLRYWSGVCIVLGAWQLYVAR